MIRSIHAFSLIALLSASCATLPTTGGDDEERLTVGTAQREIHLGMPSADVAEALGSPNLVSTDGERREVWVYDRISTEVIRADASAGIWVLLFGSSGGGLTGIGGSRSKETTTQRTLTIIVKFDGESRVRDFSYHTSRF
jgi:outer membrane protein assembly factor BamE (lipoprotein component of BamABCDE complex)